MAEKRAHPVGRLFRQDVRVLELAGGGLHRVAVHPDHVGQEPLGEPMAPDDPGGRVDLHLTANDSSGLPYQLGTSLGTGPIAVGMRRIDLSPDDLLLVSVVGYWPWVFSGYRGVIDANGEADAVIHIPNNAMLIGVRLHSAFVTLAASAPSGIQSISNTFSFSITK